MLIVICAQIMWSQRNIGQLKIAFLDVGQGDAIYIESPDHHDVLIDSGPDAKVLQELQRVMRWHDRRIDMIISTNPDRDHIAGFIPVLERYKVDQFVESSTINTSEIYKALESSVEIKDIQKTIALRGQRIHIGSGAYIDILFPDRNVLGVTSNTGSIIAKLVYGSTSVMLTGDATYQTEEYVVDLEKENMKSDLLKEGHHGSRTSISEKFFAAVAPIYSIISAKKNNSYGHPHKETTDMLSKLKIPILGTYNEGTIVFVSDGKSLVRKK